MIEYSATSQNFNMVVGKGRYDRAVVLMTALVPTVGHKNLITFAASLAGKVTVILSSRKHEPIPGIVREAEFVELTKTYKNVEVKHHTDDNAPQVPSSDNDEDFWQYWKKVVTNHIHDAKVSERIAMVSSETYGLKMAQVTGFDFVPYDIGRIINPVKGTDVRLKLQNGLAWKKILPLTQNFLQTRVCIFGPESCGKTTMAKQLSQAMTGYYIPEWARSYCETVGVEITKKKMEVIVEGQIALEQHAFSDLYDKEWQFFDTDILSTYGYYKLWDKNFSDKNTRYSINRIHSPNMTYELTGQTKVQGKNFHGVQKDIYIVMNDKIPFEADPMRYGGDKRESNMDFWIDILKDFNQTYHVVESTYQYDQIKEVIDVISKVRDAKIKPVADFIREI